MGGEPARAGPGPGPGEPLGRRTDNPRMAGPFVPRGDMALAIDMPRDSPGPLPPSSGPPTGLPTAPLARLSVVFCRPRFAPGEVGVSLGSKGGGPSTFVGGLSTGAPVGVNPCCRRVTPVKVVYASFGLSTATSFARPR